MPLSEHEQRVLEQIEQSLIADDPRFSAAVKSTDARVIAARKIRIAVAVVLLGLVLLVLGVWLNQVVVGVIGFLVMFGGGVIGLMGLQTGRKAGPPVAGSGKGKGAGKSKAKARSSMKDRLEERLRRRFDQ